MSNDAVKALQDAVQAAPDNVALRRALAGMLAGLGRYDEAQREFKQALSLAPDNADLKLALASCFLQMGKDSAALVIVEDLIRARETPPKTYLLHARLLVRAGDKIQAERQYRKAIDADPSLAEPDLASRVGASSSGDVVDGKIRIGERSGPDAPSVEMESPAVSFRDIGGMESVKEEIRMKIILPLQHPEMFKAYGKAAGGGILLYGPPGCGKTHLARATAGEIKAKFLAIGINDVLDMWLGMSEKNLHAVFEQARESRPCVLFFDEVDALGASRSDMRQSAGRQLINQFLAELDGIKASNEGVLILAATNAPWHLDTAFRRPGRFDRVLFVPPPDAAGRAAILRILVKGRPVEEIDFEQVAKKTDGFSGADLKGLLEAATEAKLREALKAGVVKPIATRDLLNALGGAKATTSEWFATARNYALYANQGGLYDEIKKHLNL